jgi:hypothetical protein
MSLKSNSSFNLNEYVDLDMDDLNKISQGSHTLSNAIRIPDHCRVGAHVGGGVSQSVPASVYASINNTLDRSPAEAVIQEVTEEESASDMSLSEIDPSSVPLDYDSAISQSLDPIINEPPSSTAITTPTLQSSSNPTILTHDPTLSLWDIYPSLTHPVPEYTDPFENSHLGTRQSLPFRTLMLEHKHNLDMIFKTLQKPHCAQTVRVNYVSLDLDLRDVISHGGNDMDVIARGCGYAGEGICSAEDKECNEEEINAAKDLARVLMHVNVDFGLGFKSGLANGSYEAIAARK